MKLSHSASFHCWPYNAPSNAGTKQLTLGVKDEPVFAWAGMWRHSDEWGDCYTGVMTDNAPELKYIHDRSLVILERDQWHTWLHAPLADLYQFDRPYPAQRMIVEITDKPWAR